MDHRPMPKALLSAIWCRLNSVLEEKMMEVRSLPQPKPQSSRYPTAGSHTPPRPAAPGHRPPILMIPCSKLTQ